MNYKQCSISEEGFVIPDFDFDSTNAVIPISAFSPYSYEFNTTDDFVNLIEAVEKNDIELILKYLCIFKASVIDNANDLPELLFNEYCVPEILMNLIDPIKYTSILYESLCTAIAWTGAQSRDTDVFNNDQFIYFLIETAVYALSDQKFTGDKRIGNAAIGLLRNLVNNSEDIRVLFIKMNGIKLFSSLYLEITDSKIKDYILWILQNCLNVGSEPPYDLLKDVEIVLRSSFTYLMNGVTQSEIRIAIAYVKCGPKFAISLMENLDFEISSVHFEYALPDTQYSILDLFETLLFYPDDYVSNLASKKVKWGEVMLKIPKLMDKRLNKKFVSISYHYFSLIKEDPSCKYVNILNTPIIKALIRIFESSEYSIKLKVIDCLNILITSDTDVALDSIITHNCINQIVPFLDDQNSRVLDFTLRMILYIIKFAQSENIQNKVIEQLDRNEFGPAIEEFCAEQHKQEISELADFVKNEYEQLSNSFDENQMSAFRKQKPGSWVFGACVDQTENEDFQNDPINYDELSKMNQNPGFSTGFQMNDDDDENQNEGFHGFSVNYEELSKMHQNPGFPTGFAMNDDDDETQNEGFHGFSINYEELSKMHQNPGFQSFFDQDDENKDLADADNDNDNDNDNGNDNDNEEEDVWVDADDVDFE